MAPSLGDDLMDRIKHHNNAVENFRAHLLVDRIDRERDTNAFDCRVFELLVGNYQRLTRVTFLALPNNNARELLDFLPTLEIAEHA